MDGVRKERRGFASMSPEKQREIASKGGRAAHEKGTAHEWTPDEARAAGRKGGQISRGGRGRLMPGPAADVNNATGGSCFRHGARPRRLATSRADQQLRLDRKERGVVLVRTLVLRVCSLAALARPQPRRRRRRPRRRPRTDGRHPRRNRAAGRHHAAARAADVLRRHGPVVRADGGNLPARPLVVQRVPRQLRSAAGSDRRQSDRCHRRGRPRRSLRAVRIVADGPARSRRAARRSFRPNPSSAACRRNIRTCGAAGRRRSAARSSSAASAA